MGKDVESGETTALLKKDWLQEFEKPPVGGYPGNPACRNQLTLAFRTSFFACILASAIWIPETKPYIDQGFAKFIPLSVLMIFFTMQPVFGSIIGSATAAITGTFFACLNIFILRGFFPDGVTPGAGHFSPASIVGWLDLAIFNMVLLTTDVRMGLRMFAMGHNTGYMLAFLNPADQSVFSKNFKINPDGIAVNCLKVTFMACSLTCLANLLPTPFGWAVDNMKANARRVSAYVAKNFISSVDYYQGTTASVLIEKQMESTVKVESEIGGMGASIDGAWYEGFDVGKRGVVRNLHSAHKTLLGELLDITKAMEIAIKTEDFAESHCNLMKAIGNESGKLADSTGQLLMEITSFAGDGDVSSEESAQLAAQEDAVKADMKALAKAFDDKRREFDPIHREVLNESFFVFTLSAYARKVVAYSDTLRNDPPVGDSFMQMAWKSFKGTFTLDGVGDAHSAIATRSWVALMLAFIYGVALDNYGGAAAVTIVFLQSTRVAPDIEATLKVLQAVAIASVLSSIIYARSCQTGYGEYLLPILSFLYWWGCLYVNFSGCSFALIGLLAAALSPFVLVVRCPAPEEVSGTAGALGLWIGVRGFLIALFIMSIAEYLSSKHSLSKIAYDNLDNALAAITEALQACWDKKDPGEALEPVAKACSDAKTFGKAAVMEPRYYKCKWKYELLTGVTDMAESMRLDITFMRQAMCGADGKTKGVFACLEGLPAFAEMKADLLSTLAEAKGITNDLLKHDFGPFKGLDRFPSLEGIDELDGLEQALKDVNKVEGIAFPTDPIETLEDDLLCQISIIFLMLEFFNKHLGNIIAENVRQS
jgi:hypothetical protein